MADFNKIYGCPTEDNTIVVEVRTATSAVVNLEANCLYRFASTQDCCINISSTIYTAATLDGVPIFKGSPEYFTTTNKNHYLSAIRITADGDLYITKMLTASIV